MFPVDRTAPEGRQQLSTLASYALRNGSALLLQEVKVRPKLRQPWSKLMSLPKVTTI